MADQAEIGIRDHNLVYPSERIVRNNWLTDIYGKILAYADMSVLDIAAVEERAGQHGAVLLWEEYAGSSYDLHEKNKGVVYEVTPEKLDVIKELAALDPNGNDILSATLDRSMDLVPGLYLAHMAIVPGKILFKDGMIVAERFDQILTHAKQEQRFQQYDENEAQRLIDHADRLEKVLLNGAGFAIVTAQHALAVPEHSAN